MASDTYVAPTYEPIGPVESFNAVPRFGHLDDISQLVLHLGDEVFQEKAISYILGTIFIASLLLASYVVFLIMITFCKCFCRKKIPILAGKPFVQEKNNAGSVASMVIRGFLVFLSIVAIISGVLFLVKGTTSVEATADHIHSALSGVLNLTSKVDNTANSFIDLGEQSSALGKSIVDIVEAGICVVPDNIPANQVPTDSLQQINDASDSVVEILNTLSDFAKSEATTIRDIFKSQVYDSISQVEDTTDLVVEYYLNSVYYAGPAIAFGCFILMGIILAFLRINIKPYFFIQTYLILPLLYIFIFSTLIVIVVIGLALVANSDICIGNPMRVPEGFVKVFSDEFFDDDATRNVINYYIVNSCRGEYDLLGEVEGVLDNTVEALERSDTLKDVLLNVDKTALETLCVDGAGPVNELEDKLENTLDVFRRLLDVGYNATDLLSCEDINKIWIDVAHNAFCTSTPTALTWMFSTMTALYIFGIFTCIFRGALLPAKVEEDNYREMPNEAVSSEEEEDGNDDQWGLLPAKTGYENKVAKSDSIKDDEC